MTATTQTSVEPGHRRAWTFGLGLAVIVAIGIAARWVYLRNYAPSTHFFDDSQWYYLQSINIREGVGYVNIFRQFGKFNGHPEQSGLFPTAYWPPLFPAFLAGFTEAFGTSIRTAQEGGLLTGGATVLLSGLLGRAIGGWRVGLLSALLVAVSPFLIAVDGSLMSETLYLPLAVLALVLAHHARNRAGAVTWLALGATIGLASLARGDALLLIPFVMLPAAVLSRDGLRHLLPRVALGLVAVAVVLAPWVIRNEDAIGQATISTLSANGVIAAANCSPVYSGPAIGSWHRPCMQESTFGARLSESAYADRLRRKGVEYALAHVDRWPVVGAARIGRVWGLWDPRDLVRREAVESRNRHWQWLVWPVSLATLVAGAIGFVLLARSRRPIAVLVGPVAMATFLALVTYGNSRFRTLAEPALLVGTAVALLALWDALVRSVGGTRTAAAS